MAESSVVGGFVKENRSLTICVEPVEVELSCARNDDYPTLLLSTLQAALPGATALYYYSGPKKQQGDVTPNDHISRSFINFDGQRFHFQHQRSELDSSTPTYYSQLHGCGRAVSGGRFPLKGYTQASAQFERSVKLVQQMMESLGDGEGGEMKVRGGNRTRASRGTDAVPPAPSAPTTMDRQFADLALISQGKDAIIERQREELKLLEAQLGAANERIASLEGGELTALRSKSTRQEQELEIFRNLGREQASMSEQVRRAVAQLREVERLAESKTEELQRELTERQAEIEELRKEKIRADELVENLAVSEKRGEEVENHFADKLHVLTEGHVAEISARDEQLKEQGTQIRDLTAMVEQMAKEGKEMAERLNAYGEGGNRTAIPKDNGDNGSDHLFSYTL